MSASRISRACRALLWTGAGLLAACSEGPAPAPASAPDPAPDAAPASAAPPVVEFLDGARQTPEDFRGQWLFVNYWAEWCAPCLEEIPELNALHEESEDAFVFGVNFDGLPADEMRPQVDALGIRFPVATEDPSLVFEGLELPEVLPSTYVFDPEGRRAAVLLGPQSIETLRAAMVADEAPIGD